MESPSISDGLNEPMVIVQVGSPSFPDGRYVIKNRAANIYWNARFNPITTVYFSAITMEVAKRSTGCQVSKHSPIIQVFREKSLSKWDITHDTNGNISMTIPFAPSSWVGAEIAGSRVPVAWQLIPAGSDFY